MPNVYRDMLNGVSVRILPSEFRQVPGGIILNSLPPSGDVRALFDAFCRYFRHQRPWTWIGSAMTPSAGDILDGVSNTGQCAALAIAFRTLATRSRPYGLGYSEAQVGSPSSPQGGYYQGRNGNGFVSEHRDLTSPPGTVLSLRSNIFSAPPNPDPLVLVTAAAPRTTHYLWQNHKTVPYLGRYYDVLYGKIWDSKEQMATWNLDAGEPIKRIQYTATNQQYITSFLPARGATGLVYFRQLLDVESQAVGIVGYQGPYATLPGSPWFATKSSVSDLKRQFNK